jgi:hypothetical protein
VVNLQRKRPAFKKPARKIPTLVKTRIRRPPLTVRGPRAFVKRAEQTDAPGLPPAGLVATLPEWHVYWWLEKRRRLIAGLEFDFQSSLFGGRMDKGGLVVDFLLPFHFGPPGLVLNVQGYNWHYASAALRADALADKIRLVSQGHAVVYLLEDDLLDPGRLDRTMSMALQGTQLFPDTV